MGRPDNIYQRIDGTQWRHVWVVGDIHGCFSMLMAKLRQYRFDPWQDLLVSVGDVIDRGPDSLRCLKLLRKRWIVAVRGIMNRWRWTRWRRGSIHVVNEWWLVVCAGGATGSEIRS